MCTARIRHAYGTHGVQQTPRPVRLYVHPRARGGEARELVRDATRMVTKDTPTHLLLRSLSLWPWLWVWLWPWLRLRLWLRPWLRLRL